MEKYNINTEKRVPILGFIPIFPIPILVTKYASSFEDEFKFIKEIKYTEQGKNHNFRSDNTYLLKHKELSNIKDFIYDSINKYTKQVWMTNQRLVVTQCWTNRNPPGSEHHEHAHSNSILSGVFYFRQTKALPPIQFSKDMEGTFKLNPEKYNNVNSRNFSVAMMDGDLVLFPSTLRHSVPVNKGNETRYSMSFNTFCIDELGSINNLTHLNIKELYGKI